MLRSIMLSAMLVFSSAASAHELTPTYFEFKPSLYNNVNVTSFVLFNRREDVKYYELGVFDSNWNPVNFASESKIIKVEYLERKTIPVYVKKSDVDKVVYVCTISKLIKGDVASTGVASRICSKIK